MLLGRVRTKARIFALQRSIRTRPHPGLIRLGSAYGGWWIPRDLLDKDSVCYLAGVGEDATFDLALIEELGCEVWSLDPTPRAIAYAQEVSEPRFHFLPVGLWSRNEQLRFYAPKDPQHVSHSAVNAQSTDSYFTAECIAVRTLMQQLGHDHVDLLKLDIEGAEVAVLDQLLVDGPFPRVLCVEFDAPEPLSTTLRRVGQLSRAGYAAVRTEGRNVTFVRV